MSSELWNDVDRYLCDLFVPPDDPLDEALAASARAGLPPISVAPNQGKLLMLLALAQRASTVLEIGTLGGYSTIWLARGVAAAGGRVVTLEAEPRHAKVARSNISRAGLDGVVEVRVGKAADSLPRLVEEGAGPFDLVFIDADKPGYPDYFAWSLQLTRPGSVIVADNVVRAGAVADPANGDAMAQGVRRFNELVAAEPRVSATVVQTVGSKGHDGFLLAVVLP